MRKCQLRMNGVEFGCPKIRVDNLPPCLFMMMSPLNTPRFIIPLRSSGLMSDVIPRGSRRNCALRGTLLSFLILALSTAGCSQEESNASGAGPGGLFSNDSSSPSSAPTPSGGSGPYDDLIRNTKQSLSSTVNKPELIATVIVKNVSGDADDAEKFIRRLIGREASSAAQAERNRAAQQTERNRQQAEDEVRRTTGFGIYQYELEEAEYRYATVRKAVASNGYFAYCVHPVPDLNAFAKNLSRIGRVENVDSSARQVVFVSAIPTPVPDLDVEAAEAANGSRGYAILDITGAAGNVDDVKYWLGQQCEALSGVPEKNLRVTYLKQIPNDGYRFLLQPVPADLNSTASQITFGKVVGNVEQARTIVVTAELPIPVPKKPSPQELQRMAEEERRNRKSISDTAPKPDETELEWALRILKDGTSQAKEAAYKRLAAADVDPEHQEAIAGLLYADLDSVSPFRVKDYAGAFGVWKTDEIEDKVVARLGEEKLPNKRKLLIQLLEKFNTEKAARAIASRLDDFFDKDEAFDALRRMEGGAEAVFIDYLKDRQPQTRLQSVQILGMSGTEKSLPELDRLAKSDRSRDVRDAAKFAAQRIRKRTGADDPDGDKSDK